MSASDVCLVHHSHGTKRLERSDLALRDVAAYLHSYIETELRKQKRK